MAYTLHRATLALHTAFGTPLAGDTLFGQLCWALREAEGEAALQSALDGYTSGKPWVVVSDGFPSGFLPKPALPALEAFFGATPAGKIADAAKERKFIKARRWIPASQTSLGLQSLLAAAVSDQDAWGGKPPQRVTQAHNSINRETGTTGEAEFAPYSMPQTFYGAGYKADLYLVFDPERIAAAKLRTLLDAVGATGFGRDASIGLGKFTVDEMTIATPPPPSAPGAWWTLGPCAPQGQAFNKAASYYRTFTRFGRHGNVHALAGQPFKTPVLLAAAGAVFTPAGAYESRAFIGQGIGGDGSLSKVQAATVHQGYAPVLALAM